MHPQTSITYEYPSAEGDPYYPIPRPENQALYKRYEALADATPDVWFVGRLATYRYYNMDQVVGQALATFRRIEQALPGRTPPRSPGRSRPSRRRSEEASVRLAGPVLAQGRAAPVHHGRVVIVDAMRLQDIMDVLQPPAVTCGPRRSPTITMTISMMRSCTT